MKYNQPNMVAKPADFREYLDLFKGSKVKAQRHARAIDRTLVAMVDSESLDIDVLALTEK